MATCRPRTTGDQQPTRRTPSGHYDAAGSAPSDVLRDTATRRQGPGVVRGIAAVGGAQVARVTLSPTTSCSILLGRTPRWRAGDRALSCRTGGAVQVDDQASAPRPTRYPSVAVVKRTAAHPHAARLDALASGDLAVRLVTPRSQASKHRLAFGRARVPTKAESPCAFQLGRSTVLHPGSRRFPAGASCGRGAGLRVPRGRPTPVVVEYQTPPRHPSRRMFVVRRPAGPGFSAALDWSGSASIAADHGQCRTDVRPSSGRLLDGARGPVPPAPGWATRTRGGARRCRRRRRRPARRRAALPGTSRAVRPRDELKLACPRYAASGAEKSGTTGYRSSTGRSAPDENVMLGLEAAARRWRCSPRRQLSRLARLSRVAEEAAGELPRSFRPSAAGASGAGASSCSGVARARTAPDHPGRPWFPTAASFGLRAAASTRRGGAGASQAGTLMLEDRHAASPGLDEERDGADGLVATVCSGRRASR